VDLESACESAVARDKSCGTTTVYDNCHTVAVVESPDMIATYQCIAQTPCGESPASCLVPDDSALENEICGRVEKSCSTRACTPEARAMLRSSYPWLRSDAVRAAQLCLQEDFCRDVTGCLETWAHTAFAGTTPFLFFETR
jgi:hypothetical protein